MHIIMQLIQSNKIDLRMTGVLGKTPAGIILPFLFYNTHGNGKSHRNLKRFPGDLKKT